MFLHSRRTSTGSTVPIETNSWIFVISSGWTLYDKPIIPFVGWHLWCTSSVGRLTKYFFVSRAFPLSNDSLFPDLYLVCETTYEMDCFMVYPGYRWNSCSPFFLDPASTPFCWSGIWTYSSGDRTDNQEFSFHQGWMECCQMLIADLMLPVKLWPDLFTLLGRAWASPT